jgi:hypothetical protein
MTTQELINENQKERMPVPERNSFQTFLMEKMGVPRHSGQKEMDWSDAYSEIVSDIIDVKSEKEIRDLITEGWQAHQDAIASDSEEERQTLTEAWTNAYDKASDMVLKKIRSTLH